jgi:hypothetical protein
MKTEYDADAAFLYPNTGEQERRFFYALMLRSRGKKSLAVFTLLHFTVHLSFWDMSTQFYSMAGIVLISAILYYALTEEQMNAL